MPFPVGEKIMKWSKDNVQISRFISKKIPTHTYPSCYCCASAYEYLIHTYACSPYWHTFLSQEYFMWLYTSGLLQDLTTMHWYWSYYSVVLSNQYIYTVWQFWNISRLSPAVLSVCPVHGPLARYIPLWVAHTLGMLGTFSLPLTSQESAS